MKPVFTTLFAVLLAFTSYAQIQEVEETMSQGTNNALVLSVPDTEGKLIQKVWESFSKDELRTKAKWDRKTKEYLTDNANIIAISSNTIDLYAKIEERGSDASFYLWFDLGGAFLSSESHPDAYMEGEKILMKFGLAIAAQKTRDELAAQEKTLKDMGKEMDKLKKLNDRYHTDIEKAEEAIKEAKANIETNLKDQELMKERMADQNKLIESTQQKLKDLR